MSFSQLNLNTNINKAIAACGYDKPTPIQAQAIPDILNGKDLVASAQTGTGKTAAFVLPALHRLSESTQHTKKPRILILTPTRELATQIMKATSLYGKFVRFNIVNLIGGMPYHQQIKGLRDADVIVATPGRLMDHMQPKSGEKPRVDLSAIEMLVLDEADRMLDMGFIEDVEYIASLTPENRQTLLFSATVDKKLTGIVKHLLKNPVRIDLSNEKLASPQIKQELYKANNPQHKARLLKHLLNTNIFKAIIFSATKVNADKLAAQLRDMNFSAAALHGDLKQNVRNRTLDQLRRGNIQFLVATDVAARGIDVSDITHVINYDLPRFCEDYVHRIGRTGRAGKEGVAISFVLPTDTKHVQRIERYIGQRLKMIHNVELAELTPEEAAAFSEKRFDNARERDFSHKRKSFSRDGERSGDNRRSFTNARDGERSGDNRRSFTNARDGERSGDNRRSFTNARDGERSGDNRRSFTNAKDGERSSENRRSFTNRDSERSNDNRKPFNKEGGKFNDRKPFAKEGDRDQRRSFSKNGDTNRDQRRSFTKEGDSTRETRKPFVKEADGARTHRKPTRPIQTTDKAKNATGFKKKFKNDQRTSFKPRTAKVRHANES